MYKSRITKSSNKISFSVDSLNGELLSIVNEETGDNIIKSSAWMLPNPFGINIGGEEFTAPDASLIKRDPAVCPVITETEDGVKIFYPAVANKNGKTDITVTVLIRIVKESRLDFCLNLSNNSGKMINDCRFPCINGIYLGDSYRDNIMVYPYNAGLKIENPTEYLSKQPELIYWRWQQYRYTYMKDGICPGANKEGLYALEYPYSGPLSMPWADLYSPEFGIYFGSDNKNGISYLCASTFGPRAPGMNFSFLKKAETDGDFSISGITLALHGPNWYEGADIYKETKAKTKREKVKTPVSDSVSLCAHYDFKYQNGGIVHRFEDIPNLAKKARAMNTNHLLISGWHNDGFDNGFPDYRPDADLGTEEDLRNALKAAHENGVFVSFYMNTRIFNRKFKHLRRLFDEGCAVKADNTPYDEKYGDDTLDFATMCPASAAWKDYLVDRAEYLASLGADGMYLDQLGMAAPRVCHAANHNHGLYDWTLGYQEVLSRIAKIKTLSGSTMNIIIEGCSDLYGGLADGELVSTFAYYFSGAYPELYIYSNPDDKIVDMVYPSKKNVMRPEHLGVKSTEMINRTFVNGSIFWIYDLEEDNSFDNDPEQKEYLKKILALAFKVRPRLSGFEYGADRKVYSSDEGLMIRIYERENEFALLYACDGKGTKTATVNMSGKITDELTLDGNLSGITALPVEHGMRITFSGSAVGAIWFHK